MSAPSAVEALSLARVDEAAHVHAQAFAGYLNARLGLGYVRAFLSWFVEHEEALALVSVDDAGRICGYVIGAPVGYARAMSRDTFVPAAVGLLRNPRLALDTRFRNTAVARVRGLLGGRMPGEPPPTLPEPTMSLVGIGVCDAARGRGHGRALLEEFEASARRRGAAALRLSVYPDNAGARRSYELAGWRPYDGRVSPGAAMYYSKVLT